MHIPMQNRVLPQSENGEKHLKKRLQKKVQNYDKYANKRDYQQL